MNACILKRRDLCLGGSHIAAHNSARMAQTLALRSIPAHNQGNHRLLHMLFDIGCRLFL